MGKNAENTVSGRIKKLLDNAAMDDTLKQALTILAEAVDEIRVVQTAQELADSFTGADPEQSLRDMVRKLAGPGQESTADAVSDQIIGIISRVVIEQAAKSE